LWWTSESDAVAPGIVEKQNARAGGNAILGVGWRMVREWRRGEGRAFARSAGAELLDSNWGGMDYLACWSLSSMAEARFIWGDAAGRREERRR
jgi:hypothetical protein